MSHSASSDVTVLLKRMGDGDTTASEQLFDVLYDALYLRAERYMRNQPEGHTLQATALVNEACLRMLGTGTEGWKDREHFLSVAAKAMRSVLVDHARSKERVKRRAPGAQVPLDHIVVCHESRAFDLVALNDALDRYAEKDPVMARAVELRFFGGLTVEETANILGITKRTFERNWAFTKAWLYAEIQ